MLLDCHHFTSGECRSCAWIETPYADQLARKDRATRDAVTAVLDRRPEPEWLPPVASAHQGFRTKAKMVVAGTVDRPTLGILDPAGGGVDLRDCALHAPGIVAALPELGAFAVRAAVAPYDVAARTGELKHVLVTESPAGELMVRWVLRSREAEARIRKHLPSLLAALPGLSVVTINVQPEHKAVIEGEQEIVLTEQETLPISVNDVTLHLGPRSFFQTNTAIAAALYRQARSWVDLLGPRSVWDLYCGVGGFALHVAGPGRAVTGVELSAEAIASAERGRDGAGLSLQDVRFEAGDATAYALSSSAEARPELVIVNPPRRGLGRDLASWLEESGVPHVLYSSCNPDTLARDLAVMRSYAPVRGQVFDMFPQTAHTETLMLLSSRSVE